MTDFDKKEPQLRLYRLLLEKYSDLINEKEKRTIGEIKAMINAEDLTIQAIIADFLPENYSVEANYKETAEKIFEFVQNEIIFVESDININYWLSPKEILKEKIGDDEDLAVFLCSLLFALGDKKAEVIITELENMKTHAIVLTQIQEKFYIMDPSQKQTFEQYSGKKEKILANYSFNGAKIRKLLYKFNNAEYEQFI